MRTMRANDDEPVPGRCQHCGRRVLVVALPAGRDLLVDADELHADRLEPGIYVAVDAAGHARSLRVPGEVKRGEAVHRPHELACQR